MAVGKAEDNTTISPERAELTMLAEHVRVPRHAVSRVGVYWLCTCGWEVKANA